ncbi:RHS repeat-associated core domain-containing protein [Alloacidobacterium sp.]|uniref:RHS repeat domain-containing protein n=1 Tax=Alloacidobacterium sp. TaxID=2951999 RepID=UPI002D627C95|nr:RHS repeat-associated core domain-containing protein [Alloacidobacterium sp.]HYK36953.1 RHS repeat-associated core domain-containing protein [Alloacidobacterium sp.]
MLTACGCKAPLAKSFVPPPPLPVPSDSIVPTDSNSTGAAATGRFSVNSDGAATYSYPIWVPKGRRAIQPTLAIEYSSTKENGALGVGWVLQGLSSITRCKRDIARDGFNAAIQFDKTDALCLDGQRLVAFPGVNDGVTGVFGAAGTEYRTEDEQFSRVINGPTDDMGPLSFEVRLKDGRIFFYGTTKDSRLEGQRFKSTPASLAGQKINKDFTQTVRLTWSLSEVQDRFGNNMTVTYATTGDPANLQGYEQLPQAIRYTGTLDQSLAPRRSVNFIYEERPDTQTTFISGFRLQLRHRVSQINLSAPNPVETSLVKSYLLKYNVSSGSGRSLLSSVSECDANQICLAPSKFGYTVEVPDRFTDIDTGIHDDTAVGENTTSVGSVFRQVLTGDINGDGCDDIIYSAQDNKANLSQAAYRLSSCYDAISHGQSVFPAPNPDDLFLLSPQTAGAPDSGVPPFTFNNPLTYSIFNPATCATSGITVGCFNQLTALDFDLDGRADLFSYFVTQDCDHPTPHTCSVSTTWNQNFLTSIYLASSVPPAQWNPFSGLFGGDTQNLVLTTTPTPMPILGTANPPDISTYVGDINGDGFPDLVHLITTPGEKGALWSSQLNQGRALLPPLLQQKCGTPGNPCLSLGPQLMFFPGSTPVSGLTNVFMSDIFREGTTDLLLRDLGGTNWYAAYRLSPRNCLPGIQFCPVLPPPNLALVAGDAYTPPRNDYFIDVTGDGLPDSVSVPSAPSLPPALPFADQHPYIAVNTGNGFDTPVQITQGALPRSMNPATFDYDGNGTQDLIYTSVEQRPQASAWLPVDMQGNGLTEIVQLWDNYNRLGMTVWAPNANDSYSQLWSKSDMGQGSGALQWLPVHMFGDGKTQIVQLWEDNSNHDHRLAMIVWGPNPDGRFSQLWGATMGQGSGAEKWLPVDMQGDGRTEIAQLWNSHGNLGFIVWRPNADGSYSQVCCAGDTGHSLESKAVWLPVDMHGDGKTEIVELWDNNNTVGMNVWAPNANYSYSLASTSSDMGPGSGEVVWVPIDMFGDGKTEIAQFWPNHNKISVIVWRPNSNNTYSRIGGGDTNQDFVPTMRWLPVHMPGRKNAITQVWDNQNQNQLGMNVWVPDANNSFSIGWQSINMGQGSGGEWVTADLIRGNQTRIVQLWNSNPALNVHKLGMIVWVPHFDDSYSQAWGSSDMGSYLYALLTGDNGHYQSTPLLDQMGNPIRSGSNLRVFDANGDGLMDLVQILDGDIHVYVRDGIKRDLLTEVVDRGALITASYAPLSSHDAYTTTVPPGVASSAGTPTPFSPGNTYVVNRGGWVVTQYSVPRAGSLEPSDPVNSYTFSYADGRTDLHGRGWLGFGRITMTDQQTHAQTTTTYDNTTMVASTQGPPTANLAAYPLAYRPHVIDTVVTLTDSGRFNERITTTTYKTSGKADGSYVAVFPVETLRQEFEGASQGSKALIRSLDTTMGYDNFANPTQVLRKTGDGYINSSTATYQEDPALWLISAQTGAVDSSTTPTGAMTTRTTGFVPDPNTGAPLSETVEPNGNQDTYRQTTYEVDSHGIPTSISARDQSGKHSRVWRLGFDSEDLFPSFTANALGHVERFAIHPAFGSTALYEDINQVTQKRQYDGFGRPRSVLPADGANVSVTYPSGLFPEMDIKRADGYLISVYSDAYMNEVERDWTGFDGQTTILLTSYDAQGLVSEQDGPCLDSDTPCSASSSEQYTYDELGRPIGLAHADGSSRKTTHINLKTAYFDELQNQRYTLQDQLGRVTKSVAISDSDVEIPVSYGYGPFNLLETILDPRGNIIHTTYDIRGRPSTLDHPDSGKHTFSWNPFGDLREERDGNGHLTRYKRDPLGRITAIRDKDGLTDFCWDISPHGFGMIGQARSNSGIKGTYSYDTISRPVAIDSRIAGKSYEIGISFDSIGRVASITYPHTQSGPRFGIRQVFNPYGYLQQIVDANSGMLFWKANKENERGQITDEVLGSGADTQRGFDIRGFLRTISTSAGGTLVQQLAYTYFPTGSLQSRTAQLQLSTVAENFKYDALDRLREWTASSAPNTAPNNSAQSLDQTFSYDELGNLLERAITFGPGERQTYQYGRNAGPHAATQVNSQTYGYDLAGNQISGPARHMRYTSFNLPSQLKNGRTHFVFKYDAMHQRVLQRASNGDKIIYMNGLYEQRSQKGELTDIYYIPGFGHLIGQVERRADVGQTIRYFYHDHLSSVQAATDNNASAITAEVDYEPLGMHGDPSNPALSSSRGLGSIRKDFTEQTLDAPLELLDMNGRIYDPRLGRFLTPDPIVQRPMRSESLNPYSYALNNPLKWIDPSGFQSQSADGNADEWEPYPGTSAECSNCQMGEEFIIVPTTPNASSTVPSATTDDNGTISPPPLVNAPDNPGADLSGEAKSLPSEWKPYPYGSGAPRDPYVYETFVYGRRELSSPPLVQAEENENLDWLSAGVVPQVLSRPAPPTGLQASSAPPTWTEENDTDVQKYIADAMSRSKNNITKAWYNLLDLRQEPTNYYDTNLANAANYLGARYQVMSSGYEVAINKIYWYNLLKGLGITFQLGGGPVSPFSIAQMDWEYKGAYDEFVSEFGHPPVIAAPGERGEVF